MMTVKRKGPPQYGRPATARASTWAMIFAVLLVGTGATTPAAAEIIVKPLIQGGARFDSNPRYSSSNRDFDSALGTIFDVRLPVEHRTQRTSLTLQPRLVYSFYSSQQDSDLEDRDKYLTGTGRWFSQRSEIGAGYGYTNLSLRTSEFQNPGDSPGGSGPSRILSQDSQERWYIQPYWQLQFSPKNSFTLNGNYEQVQYDEQRLSRRFDYDYNAVTASFSHILNQKHTLKLQASSTKFDSENNELRITNTSETDSLTLVYEYRWSETTNLSANIGWARTKNVVMRPNFTDPVTGPFCEPAFIIIFPCETKSDSSNFIGNLTATKNTETVEYRIVLGQSITPNSNGAEVLRFTLNGQARKKFSDRITGTMGISAFTQNNIGSSEFDFQRDYIRANVRFDYGFARYWSVYGAYSYTFNGEKRLVTTDRTVRNHFLSMGITYRGDGWRW